MMDKNKTAKRGHKKSPPKMRWRGLVFNMPEAAARVDQGDSPSVTITRAEKMLKTLPKRCPTLEDARKLNHELGDWITWFRNEYGILGRYSTWTKPLQHRFNLVSRRIERAYTASSDELCRHLPSHKR